MADENKNDKWIDSPEMLDSYLECSFRLALASAILQVGFDVIYAFRSKINELEKENADCEN